MKRVGIPVLISALLLVALVGCSTDAGTGKPLEENRLVIGVTAGPHEQIMEKVKEVEGDWRAWHGNVQWYEIRFYHTLASLIFCFSDLDLPRPSAVV